MSTYYPAQTENKEIVLDVGSEKPAFATFVNKTLNYVSLQLGLTSLIVIYMYVNNVAVINALTKNPSLVWYPIIMTFVSLIGMHCWKNLRKTMFWLFTLSCSFMVGISVLQYSPGIVLNAVVTTSIIVVMANGYSIWCVKNNKDMTSLEPILGMALVTILIATLINMILKLEFVHLMITIVGIMVFSGFLVVDLAHLYSKNNQEIFDDPMLAAVAIYLDIINLFLYLLELYDKLSKCGEDDD